METDKNKTAEAKAETTAEAKAETTAEAKEERVDIFVPRGYANDEPNLIIGLNGKNYVLPRGKTSNVPKAVADEFARAQKAQEALDKRMDELLEAANQPK